MSHRRLPSRTTLTSLALALVALTGCVSHVPRAGAAFDRPVDTVIAGGTIYDGGDTAPFIGDVALLGDRIVYAGPSRSFTAKRRIDARGMIVAPGFIDPHTHADVFLRAESASERQNSAWLNQGVTTVVIGVDGGGTPDVATDAMRLRQAGIGTNVIPFVGFGAVRSRVLGDADRPPDSEELAQMQRLVASAMCEGARGFATGLFYAPQSFAETDEVIALAREAASRGGLYDTHQRDESSYNIGLLASVAEAIRIGREAGLPVHFAHIKALGVDVHGQAEEVIAAVEQARAQGLEITADQYPWLASGTSLEASLLPRWALDGGSDALRQRLADRQDRASLVEAMAENLRRRGGAENMLLTSPGRPWTGRTLAEMAQIYGTSPVEAALTLIARSIEAGGRGTNVASFNMTEQDVALFMQQPWVVTSSDGSVGHPRMFASYPEKYRTFVRDKGTIDLATFIRQSSGKVADIYGVEQRGYLKAGNFADVLVFDPANYAPRADYVNPRELSVGVAALFVNGTLAVRDSVATGELAGRVLLRETVPNCPPAPQ